MNEGRTIDLHHAIEGHTGGTTGKSLIVYFTKEDFQKRMAYLDNFREMHGAKNRMRRATFSGKNIMPLKDENKNIFYIFHIFISAIVVLLTGSRTALLFDVYFYHI